MLVTRKILVCLDGSEMDKTLMSFVSFILKSSPAEEVYFMNVLSDLSDVQDASFTKLNDEVLKFRKEDIHKQVTSFIPADTKAHIHVIVKKGSPSREVLKALEAKDIDVVISGNKWKSKGSGVFNQRLARRAPCSLIVIPEGHMPELKKLLIPIDFSQHSQMALEYGVFISKSNDFNVELILQNVYHVPTGYHYSGKSYKDFASIMQENAKKEYDAWISKIDTLDTPISLRFSLDDHDDFGQTIKDMVIKEEVSGILIGAKGRTAASALFIGSTAEKLIHAIDYLPLTIVRKKGSNATVLESLREL